LEKLALALEFEASGKAHIRGIHDKYPEMQTFEIFLSNDLMKSYRRDYMQNVNSAIKTQEEKNAMMGNEITRFFSMTPQIPDNMNLELVDAPRANMNRLMMKYIEKVRMNPDQSIRDRSSCDRLLNLSPSMPANQGLIMFKDSWGSFIKYFLTGMDFDFLMLNVLVITFMERETQRHAGV